MRRTLLVAIAMLGPALPGATSAQDRPIRDWPSARLRGSTPDPPPCSCRGPSGSVTVGEDACIATPSGGRRARCVMVLNNTSWAISAETCGAVALLASPFTRPAARR